MNTAIGSPALVERDEAHAIGSISLTVLLAAYTHAYDFGPAAYVAAAIVMSLLAGTALGYRRSRHRALLVVYALLSLWVIGGFGIVGGFWNHAVKLAICAAHGGAVPPSLEPWFMSPEPGSLAFETAGVLMFPASVVAAVLGWRFVRGGRRSVRG